MANPDSKIAELINYGKSLLSLLPKKSKLSELEATIKNKYPDSKQKAKRDIQLKYLKEEHARKTKEIQQKYSEWYNTCFDCLNKLKDKTYSSKLEQTKENLEFHARIKSTLDILEQFKKVSKKIEEENSKLLVQNLIEQGENNKLEFKSSLRWDWKTNSLNKFLEIVINKTLSAFLNSHGGVLLIGVDDKGNVLGLEKDYLTLRRQDGDGFIQFLVQVMNNRIGKEYSQYISAHIKNVQEKDVCVIDVKPSETPVFIKYDNKEEFYIRASATSQPLNIREATEYIKMRWKK